MTGLPNWRDNHPDRYGPLIHGDYCVMCFDDGWYHFVKVGKEMGEVGDIVRWPFISQNFAVCGAKIPDWENDPKRYFLGGIVNCSACLFEYWEANQPDGSNR